jgi:transcriptional regulator GlxA family with amidase domain
MSQRPASLRIVRSTTQSARDALVARALDAMKAEPSRRWTVKTLGRVAGLSRAAFARRFTHALGISPLRWLAEHRLSLAKTLLAETDVPLSGIAADVGYQCEFAFAKAFKRVIGVAPGIFRRHARVMASATAFRAAA